MSVRIFGYFWPFSTFLAGRALCLAPHRRPDAWTDGQNMVCCFCMLVPMAHMPREQTEAPSHRGLAQGECGQFCRFPTRGFNSGHHHAMAHADFWEPSTGRPPLYSHQAPHGIMSPVSKPTWRENLGDTLVFCKILGSPNQIFIRTPVSTSIAIEGSRCNQHKKSNKCREPYVTEKPQ